MSRKSGSFQQFFFFADSCRKKAFSQLKVFISAVSKKTLEKNQKKEPIFQDMEPGM